MTDRQSAHDVEDCIHGLDPRTCATCKHGPEKHTGEEIERRLTAHFGGQCPGCNLPIYREQNIVRTTWGRYLHKGCL